MATAANAIDEEWVEKKLKGANSSQDSVQSLSLWALNHKTQHEKIVSIWFKVMKTAKLDLRLTLFYLCNEVVQTCRRKHAIVFKDAFKEVLKDAALLVRDNSIRSNIERIFKIWEERHVYNKEFVDELMVVLDNTKVKSSFNTRLLAEFKPAKSMKLIRDAADEEEEVEAKRLRLSDEGWHSIDVETFKQLLKDRSECGQYVDQVNSCRMELERYVSDLETEMQNRSSLVQVLEQSELYYDAQNGEANIVATAYKNFGGRVNALHAKLEQLHRAPTSGSNDANAIASYFADAAASSLTRGTSSGAVMMSDRAMTPTEDEFDDDSLVGDDDAVNVPADIDPGAESTEDDDEKNRERINEGKYTQQELASPEYSLDSSMADIGDVVNERSPTWPNVISSRPSSSSSSSSSFLPPVASHSNVRLAEIPAAVPVPVPRTHPPFKVAVPANATPTRDEEEPGGATPVQDEEPNYDDLPGKVVVVDSVKQATVNSNNTSFLHQGPGDARSHPMHVYAPETGGVREAVPPLASAPPWTNYHVSFAPSIESQLNDATGAVYEAYDENYELVYPASEAYEIYGGGDGTSETAYVVEVLRPDGVMEVYPSEADFHGAYADQVMEVIDETGEVVYPVVTGGDAYRPRTMSGGGAYYGEFSYASSEQQASVAVSVSAIAGCQNNQHQSMVYPAMQGFTQPPPFGQPSNGQPSLTSFSHPPPPPPPLPPNINHHVPPPVSYIHPHPPLPRPLSLNQPLPSLFAVQQNHTLPPSGPPLPPPPICFVAPPLQSPYRLLPPPPPQIPVKTPTALVRDLMSSLDNVVMNSPFLRSSLSMTSGWNHRRVPFGNDRAAVGTRAVEDFDGFSDNPRRPFISSYPAPRYRRTNLTYLTQVPTTGDDNGRTTNDDDDVSEGDDGSCRRAAAALRFTSRPCNNNAHSAIDSLSSPDRGDAVFRKSSATTPEAETDVNASEFGEDAETRGNIGCDESTNGRMEEERETRTDEATNHLASNVIPSLALRGWSAPRPTNSNCRPPQQRTDFHAVPPPHDSLMLPAGERRFPRKPPYLPPVTRLPFEKNFFRDNY